MPFGLGVGELLIILALLLLVFGAKRLPELGGALGRGIREFKTSVKDIEGELKRPADQPNRSADQPNRELQRPANSEPRADAAARPAEPANREEPRA